MEGILLGRWKFTEKNRAEILEKGKSEPGSSNPAKGE